MFASISCSTSSVSGSGGITSPSWNSSVELAGRLPGHMPPTSAWWARDTSTPRSSTVDTSVMSGR